METEKTEGWTTYSIGHELLRSVAKRAAAYRAVDFQNLEASHQATGTVRGPGVYLLLARRST